MKFLGLWFMLWGLFVLLLRSLLGLDININWLAFDAALVFVGGFLYLGAIIEGKNK